MVSLYEIYNRQLVTGATRLALAMVNTFGLAFGASIGLWIAWYAGSDRNEVAGQDCKLRDLDHAVSHDTIFLFYGMSLFGALMQFRVGVRQWPICLVIQALGVGSQYLIGTHWKQPPFIANVLPTFLVTVAAHILLSLSQHWDWAFLNLKLPLDAYRKIKIRPATTSVDGDSDGSLFRYANTGMAHGQQRTGYTHHDKRHYKSTDLWFCILPAIYLLVPGSFAFTGAFTSIWNTDGTGGSAGSALFPVLMIGLGQALGVRLGMASLGLGMEGYFHRFVESVGKRKKKTSRPVPAPISI